MFVSNGIGRNDMYRMGGRTAQTSAPYSNWMSAPQGADAAKTAAEKKRMLRDGKDGQGMTASRSLVEESFSYAESLRKSRMKKKDTQQKLKKLHYSFKSISSQLLQSRTSVDAAKVVRKARREVISLQGKRLHENAKYDSYELEAAIAHAQAMLLVARKKVKHLQEEEMARVGGICAGGLEEEKDRENEPAEDEKAVLEQLVADDGNRPAEEEAGEMLFSQDDAMLARQEWIQVYEEAMRQSDLRETAVASMSDAMEDFTDEMSDSMRELLEEMGLSELAESTSGAKVDMDPADYKQMKLKHRLEEMRAIALADAQYLKTMFNRMEKARESAAQAGSGQSAAQNGGSSAVVGVSSFGGMAIAANGGAAHAIDVVSTPDAVSTVAAVPAEGASVDVSA